MWFDAGSMVVIGCTWRGRWGRLGRGTARCRPRCANWRFHPRLFPGSVLATGVSVFRAAIRVFGGDGRGAAFSFEGLLGVNRAGVRIVRFLVREPPFSPGVRFFP